MLDLSGVGRRAGTMSQLGYLQVPLCCSLQLQWKRTQSVPNSLCQLIPLLGNPLHLPSYSVNSLGLFYVMMGSLISLSLWELSEEQLGDQRSLTPQLLPQRRELCVHPVCCLVLAAIWEEDAARHPDLVIKRLFLMFNLNFPSSSLVNAAFLFWSSWSCRTDLSPPL